MFSFHAVIRRQSLPQTFGSRALFAVPVRERLLREFPILHASAPMSSPGDAASVVVNAGDSGAGDAAGVVVNAGDAGAALAVTLYISNRHRGTIGPAHLV